MTRGLCAAVMTAALVACAPSPSAVASARHRPPAAATAGTTHNWVQNAWTTHLLNQSYPANAAYFYDRGGSFGTGPGTSSDPVLDGFATTPVLRYTSFAQFSADLANGVIPNGTWPAGSWVEYDNEQWNLTPLGEQQSPGLSMQDFGTAAHQAGFRVFMTPARDLGNVDTECVKQAGWDNNTWYEQCHIARYAVLNGDGVVVQDQSNTLDPVVYQTLFNDAYDDVQASNPAAFTDAELSDGYGTPAQAFTAGNVLNRTRCAGFFIHVANSDVGWEDTL